MEEKFSEQTLSEREEMLIKEAAHRATVLIRSTLYQQLALLSNRFPMKWFSFNGKFVTIHEKEDELDSLT